MAVTNHYAASTALIAKISALSIPGIVTVGSPSLIVGVSNLASMLPAVFVMPNGGNISDGAEGRLQQDDQRWLISVCVKHVKDITGITTTESIAGAYITPLINGLVGWEPDADHKPMVMLDELPPVYDQPGLAEFTFEFSSAFNMQGV